MRATLTSIFVLGVTFLIHPFLAPSQTNLALPGCEPSSEVRKVLDGKLDSQLLDKMKFAERIPYERRVLEDLIAKYPRELQPYQRLIQTMRTDDPDAFPAIQARVAIFAAENPNDPLALTVGGIALFRKDTPESIRLLEAAKTKAPNFPWASLALADIYFSGKRADNTKVAENIAAFFSVCPASTDGKAQWILAKNAPLQPKVALALRARLEKETDPKRLRDYELLWGLEFRTRPPAEHDALRKQISLDLKRLESLNPRGDAEWLAFLIKGYRQSGASKEAITAMEDRLISEFPKSAQASEIVQDRWQKANKEPEDQADAVAWAKYDEAYKQAEKEWMREFPDDTDLQRYSWFYAIYDDDKISETDGIAALDHFLKSAEDYYPPQAQVWTTVNAASFLTDHDWQPARAIELANRASTLANKQTQLTRQNDNISPEDLKNLGEQEISQRLMFEGLLLKAAKQAGKPEAAQSIHASVEAAPPADKKFLASYWRNRARLAALDNHKQDALAYYQLSLQSREEPPKAYRGKLEDLEMEEAHALWKELGGTEAAWAVWSKPPSAKSGELVEGRWEKPAKEIPSFDISDLSGKTWRLKELGGKTLLINLWATWCGPCNAELPSLEKFYEKVKDRPDIQVLTFNLDEDLGLVAPYLQDKGYTFPVLPAYSVVVSLLDGYAIPQNWIVDQKGIWRWTQIGYGGGTEAEFDRDMLQKLESLKTNP
jgi:thiol-disulfide isomerase/thioredoxin